jgi:diguanylate cyclase (GGDEF)-like protein
MPSGHNHAKMPDNKMHDGDLAYIDDLTSLHNRRFLNTTLSKEIAKMKKEKEKLSLFMMDCDGFKEINDKHGHLNGDRVLIGIADILRKTIGEEGIVARYAGDEFTIVLPKKSLKESVKIADKLLQLSSERQIELKEGKKLPGITLSIGIAVYPDDAKDAEELIDKADQALYSSKRRGKNRASTVKDLVDEVHDRNLVVNALPCKKFINREKEMALLKDSYGSAKKGEKKFILIDGKHGVGKTRLMLELFASDKECPRFLLKCRRENVEQPYGGISGAFNEFLDFLKASEVLKILASLDDMDKYALVSTVHKIKDLPISYSKGKSPSAKDLREEDIFSSFTNFIKQLELKTIPVLVDDMLWIDKGSSKIIKWMLGETLDIGVLVAGTMTKTALEAQPAQKALFTDFFRDEIVKKALETINLGPLTEGSASALLQSIFSGPLLPSDVEKKISRLSWGFPSNIEEIIKYMLDNKIVYPRKGKWVLDKEQLNKMPGSLKELLDKRISGLDDESKDILSKASVLGNDFDVNTLKLLYGKNEGELLDVLDRLRNKGILQRSLLPGQAALSFVNNIVKENVYSAIEKRKLQQLHRKVAELLESYYQTEIGRVYGKLSHHLKEAGEAGALESLTSKYDLLPSVKDIAEEEPSVEEIIETPLSEKSQKIAPDLIPQLRAAWLNSQLYPSDNKTRTDSIKNLHGYIAKILANDATLTVTVSGENILLNGRQVSRRKASVVLSRSLATLFNDYDINSITFKRGVNEKEVEALFSFLSDKPDHIDALGGLTKLLKEKHIRNIKVGEVKYRKESELIRRPEGVDELFKKMMPLSSAMGELFSVDKEGGGVTVNKEAFKDPKKAIDSLYDAITAISQQEASEENKSFMILEGLSQTAGELEKKDVKEWGQGKKKLGELFLSLNPSLRTKIIKESASGEKGFGDFIVDVLSGLNRKEIIEILHEAWFKAGMQPQELDKFLEIVLRSQYSKKASYEDIQKLLEEAGIAKEIATKTLNDVFAKSFFNDIAKELIDGGKTEELGAKSVENLRPLTEALIIKGDVGTVEKLIESLLVKIKSSSPQPVRISAVSGLGKVLEVLLEKEVFDAASKISAELTKLLKTEKSIDVYVELMNDLQTMVDTVIHKQKPSLLISPFTAIKEAVTLPDNRPADFRNHAQEAMNRIISPKNIELLLFSLRRKAEKESVIVIDLLAQFGAKMIDPLMELLFREDDAKMDPFDLSMKRRYIALTLKKIGEEAARKLKDLLNDKRPFVVKNTIEVLKWINDKKYLPYLEHLAKHPDREVRREALNVAKKLKE